MGASLLTLERMKQGRTQKDVARLAGIHKNAMNGIERRRLVATPEKRQAILGVIGGSEDDFFDRQTGLAL
jgi:transcriptional regulator with XRE-family HTH domain